jgi:hypothetical protein
MRLYDPLSVIYTGDCAVHIVTITDNGDLKKHRKIHNEIVFLRILAQVSIWFFKCYLHRRLCSPNCCFKLIMAI